MHTFKHFTVGIVALLAVVRAHAQAPCEDVRPIQPPDSIYVRVNDLNNWGQAVGAAWFPGPYVRQPFVWRDGETRVLPRLDEQGHGEVQAINDWGIAVGSAADGERGTLPVVWMFGTIRPLPIPDGRSAEAIDINNLGQVVGSTWSGLPRCLLWKSLNSQPIDLGTLGGSACYANAINDLGVVVGWSITADLERHGFVWKDGVMTDIGIPEGAPAGVRHQSELFDVNNAGVAVGFDFVSTYANPLIWSRRSGTQAIPMRGDAAAVNEWGSVAVVSHVGRDVHLLLFDRAGNQRDYGSVGTARAFEVALNERYQVAWTTEAQSYFCQLR